MVVEFLQSAEADIQQALAYYKNQDPKLEAKFKESLRLSIEYIEQFPYASSQWAHGARRCLLQVFPYGILYEIIKDKIVVYAVVHLHSEPSRWSK